MKHVDGEQYVPVIFRELLAGVKQQIKRTELAPECKSLKAETIRRFRASPDTETGYRLWPVSGEVHFPFGK